MPCPDHLRPLLGTLSDDDLAARAGVSRWTARDWRLRAGMRVTRRGRPRGGGRPVEDRLSPERLADLRGPESSAEVAARWGCLSSYVRRLRAELANTEK